MRNIFISLNTMIKIDIIDFKQFKFLATQIHF